MGSSRNRMGQPAFFIFSAAANRSEGSGAPCSHFAPTSSALTDQEKTTCGVGVNFRAC